MCDRLISPRMCTWREADNDLEQPHGPYAVPHVKTEAVVDPSGEDQEVTSAHMTANPSLSDVLWEDYQHPMNSGIGAEVPTAHVKVAAALEEVPDFLVLVHVSEVAWDVSLNLQVQMSNVLLVIKVLDLCLEFVTERFLADDDDVVVLVISLLGDLEHLVLVRPRFVDGDVSVQDSDGLEHDVGCFSSGVVWETLISRNVIHKVRTHDDSKWMR